MQSISVSGAGAIRWRGGTCGAGSWRAAGSWDERFAIAGTDLIGRYAAGRTVEPEVAYCWDRMLAGRGRTRVERLAAEVGWSRKRLWARSRSQVGLTPKRATQLIRFDHAAHRLAVGRSPAVVAAEGGYADQSHPHRDVRTFAGVTPGTVAAAPFPAADDVAWPGSGAGCAPVAPRLYVFAALQNCLDLPVVIVNMMAIQSTSMTAVPASRRRPPLRRPRDTRPRRPRFPDRDRTSPEGESP